MVGSGNDLQLQTCAFSHYTILSFIIILYGYVAYLGLNTEFKQETNQTHLRNGFSTRLGRLIKMNLIESYKH